MNKQKFKEEDKKSNLLPVQVDGKEESLIGKQLHNRIEEMFRTGRKKKEIARLLGVDIKTVRRIVGGEE